MSPKTPKRTVLLFDGHSLAYRAFYALPPDLRTTTGQVTNAVYGFTSMLIKALGDFKTEYIAVAFDRGAPVERLEIRPEYKAQRISAPDEFRQQLGLIHEVLGALRIPLFEIENTEADDLIHIIGNKIAEEGGEVVIVTADRDFFQMVGPRVRLMMNRRGISETVIYDEKGVFDRYGFGPERYLEYAALRGDPSDNIEGVPGVGEKTAARLIQTYGTLEEMFANIDALTPKLRANLLEAKDRLLENREFFRLRTKEKLAGQGVDVEQLNFSLEDLRMGTWDYPTIRRLFDILEFRTLYERLAQLRPGTAFDPGFEAETAQIEDLAALKALIADLSGAETITLRVHGAANPREPGDAIGIAVPGGARVVAIDGKLDSKTVWTNLAPLLSETSLVTHNSKEAMQRLMAAGLDEPTFAMDTELAAYLVDPAAGNYGLDELARRYIQRELRLEAPAAEEGQQSLLDETADTGHEALGLEAIAVAELSEVLEKELKNRGAWDLFNDLELPLARVLAKMEKAGIKIDVSYLDTMASSMSAELRTIEEEIYGHAGGPFNINSPPQLRQILYEDLKLKPTKKTKTGYSTDATVLESLREEHPIVDAILRYRERSKLKSTYVDALPPLVDPRTGRLHCRFNQTVATTGRLSSDSPNLQNIPIRTEEGRQIRRAFIPEDGYELVAADYSQIELRILAHLSRDEELMNAFLRDADIHRASIAKALGIEENQVTPELRSIGKMVSFGVTYGMGPFGLSQRLHIPVDQARTYIDGFFALYPRVREYLDEVVARATQEGFTTTMLGRRRYLPELQARNPRVKSLGERMALNAPIQGSAADVMKLAMVKVDAMLPDPSRMLLTVHDELIFEVPVGEVEKVAEAIRETMETAISLDVPLKVEVSHGPNWEAAK